MRRELQMNLHQTHHQARLRFTILVHKYKIPVERALTKTARAMAKMCAAHM
jgi:hypothetical protein